MEIFSQFGSGNSCRLSRGRVAVISEAQSALDWIALANPDRAFWFDPTTWLGLSNALTASTVTVKRLGNSSTGAALWMVRKKFPLKLRVPYP